MATSMFTRQDRGRDFVSGETFEVAGDKESFIRNIVRLAAGALERGDLAEAEQYLRHGLEREPEHLKCLAYLSICVATRSGQRAQAEKLARKLIHEYPNDATARYALGMVHLTGGKRRLAFDCFSQARELTVGDGLLAGQLQAAEPRRDPVLSFVSRDHPLNIWLGRMRAKLGR